MDELIAYCLKELAFDGDLGCDPSRLTEFITAFHRQDTTTGTTSQNVDSGYRAYIWSMLVRNPSVRVGIAPPGASVVSIAPRVKDKKGKVAPLSIGTTEEQAALKFVEDAKNFTLDELMSKHGSQLRIAVGPETCFLAITGMHTRPSKLTPMVYTALQFIARARANGLAVAELTKQTTYDHGNSFYLVKQLQVLDLVVKIPKGGISPNLVIHKHFFTSNPIWRQIRSEEQELPAGNGGDSDDESGQTEAASRTSMGRPNFGVIDTRHLASFELLKNRITKLLQSSQNSLHTYQNLLIAIGFPNPIKSERRYFSSRVGEMISQGTFELVKVEKEDGRMTMCIRLPDKLRKKAAPEDAAHIALTDLSSMTLLETTDKVLLPGPIPPDATKDGSAIIAELEQEDGAEDVVATIPQPSGIISTLTLHRQLTDLIHAAPGGLTIKEIRKALGNYDRRAIDFQLLRLERTIPPAHLAWQRVCYVMENQGRERRHRYYTLANYKTICEEEGVKDERYSFDYEDAVTSDHLPDSAFAFYEDEDEIQKWMDGYQPLPPASATAKPSNKKRKNPIGLDGFVVKGRPRKEWSGVGNKKTSTSGQPKTTPKAKDKGKASVSMEIDEGGDEEIIPEPKKKGRPKGKGKTPAKRKAAEMLQDEVAGDQAVESPAKKRRLAKAKAQTNIHAFVQGELDDEGEPAAPHFDNTSVATSTIHADIMHANAFPAVGKTRVSPRKTRSARKVGVDMTESTTTSAVPQIVSSREQPYPSSSASFLQALTQPTLSADATRSPTGPARPMLELPDASLPVSDGHNESLGRESAAALSQSTSVRHPVLAQADVFSTQVDAGVTVSSQITRGKRGRPTESPAKLVPPSKRPRPASDAVVVTENEDSAGVLSSEPAPSDPPAPPTNILTDIVTSALSIDDAVVPSTDSRKRPRRIVNVSDVRRQNEFKTVLTNLGGMLVFNLKEWAEPHQELLKSLTAQGVPTSNQPGYELDRKTLKRALDALEEQGYIKTTTTVGKGNFLGGSRPPAVIVYLADTPEDRLRQFIHDYQQPPKNSGFIHAIHRVPQVKTVAFDGEDDRGNSRQTLPREGGDPREPFWQDRQTIAQLYGFILGRARRAMELHVVTLSHILSDSPSHHVVSAEHRIVAATYWMTRFPVGAYCAVVATTNHVAELDDMRQDTTKLLLTLDDLPHKVHTRLGISRSRARNRIFDLLLLLYHLGVAVPLKASTSETPLVNCASTQRYPSSFDLDPVDNTTAIADAPQYWMFNTSAPLYRYSDNLHLPYLGDWPIGDPQAATAFWKDTEAACSANKLEPQADVDQGTKASCPFPAKVISQLLLAGAWTVTYKLSLLQIAYLRDMVDPTNGSTPLEDEDRTRLDEAGYVTCAPDSVIMDFFAKERRVAEQRHEKRSRLGDRKARNLHNTEILARKAADAREQLEKQWDDLMTKLGHPPADEEAHRKVRHIRHRFVAAAGATDLERLQTVIKQTLEDPDATAAGMRFALPVPSLVQPTRSVLRVSGTSTRPVQAVTPLPIPITGKSIQELVDQQGPPIDIPRRARKKERSGEPLEPVKRRARFAWNPEYDDLARDATAIIRSRCRTYHRMDWSAIRQVFPSTNPNNVRQHVNRMTEQAGGEVYLRRLEDAWHELWMDNRGSDLLPDPNPTSPADFDLIQQITFLRQRLDKRQLHVSNVAHGRQEPTIVIPDTVKALVQRFHVKEAKKQDSKNGGARWDFMWTTIGDDHREKIFSREALTLPTKMSTSLEDRVLYRVAEGAVKMTLVTTDDVYDAEQAAGMLKLIGDESIDNAMERLINAGAVAFTLHATGKKQAPGRSHKISDANLALMTGPLPSELCEDACAIEELFTQQPEFRHWSVLAADGDVACIIDWVSNDKVDFYLDATHLDEVRATTGWSPKSMDDDLLEIIVSARFNGDILTPASDSSPASDAELPMETDDSPQTHDVSEQLGAVGCSLTSKGLVNCVHCLSESQAQYFAALPEADRGVAQKIYDAIVASGITGLSPRGVKNLGEGAQVERLIKDMQTMPVPLVFWGGYVSSSLVASLHLGSWAVRLCNPTQDLAFPRRWFDMRGNKLRDVWKTSIRSVIGTLFYKPGVSTVELLKKYDAVFDRLELLDLLRILEKSKVVARTATTGKSVQGFLNASEPEEEQDTHWHLGQAPWYHPIA